MSMRMRMGFRVVFDILFLLCPASGVQRPHKVPGPIGGGVGHRRDASRLPHTAAEVSTALRQQVATGIIPHDNQNQHPHPVLHRMQAAAGPTKKATDFVPHGPSHPANAAPASIGAAGLAVNKRTPPLLRNSEAKDSPPVAGATTQQETLPGRPDPEGNFFHVVNSQGEDWMEREAGTLHSGRQDGKHQVEVVILGSAELARTRALENPQVKQGRAETPTYPKTSMLDVPATWLEKQMPPTGMPVGTTPAVVVAPTAAPKTTGSVPAATTPEFPHQARWGMIVGIMVMVSMVGIAVACLFLMKPHRPPNRSHGTSSRTLGSSSRTLGRDPTASHGTSSRTWGSGYRKQLQLEASSSRGRSPSPCAHSPRDWSPRRSPRGSSRTDSSPAPLMGRVKSMPSKMSRGSTGESPEEGSRDFTMTKTISDGRKPLAAQKSLSDASKQSLAVPSAGDGQASTRWSRSLDRKNTPGVMSLNLPEGLLISSGSSDSSSSIKL